MRYNRWCLLHCPEVVAQCEGAAMSDRMPKDLSLTEKLAWIDERMKGVTEEEVLAALREDEENDAIDRSALQVYLATIAKELEQCYGSVSTQTL